MPVEAPRFLPPKEKLLPEIQELDLQDKFGQQIMTLVAETFKLEEQGLIQGWPTRLLLYELERRRTWFTTIRDEVQPPFAGPRLRKLIPDFYRRLMTPGKYLPWDEMMDHIQGKSVRLEHGGYRAIPTPIQIKHLRESFLDALGAEVNVVAFEPVENTAIYKKPDLIVFPDVLRAEFLRHIPTVDIVTRVPQFGDQSPRDFWREKYAVLSRQAKKLEIISSFETWPDRVTLARSLRDVISQDTWRPDSVLGDRDYFYWNTGKWDEISAGEEELIALAKEHLLNI
jgi:hypothetical protein